MGVERKSILGGWMSACSHKQTFGKSPKGVNIGDILAEDEDICGEGVNVAARLEGLAEQGWPVEKLKALAKLYRRRLVGPKRQAKTLTRGPRRACRPR